MTYRIRNDEPGAWHHVMNRGLSKRSIFESPKDYRYFIACMGWAVHSGWMEVHAYSLLANHFHLLVRSPQGRLSHAMQQIESSYVIWFNRRYKRDGPLFRGRFRSKRIESDMYWRAVVRYIDRNPVEIGLVRSPELYPFGSARHYASRSGPRWLSRKTIENIVAGEMGKNRFIPADYSTIFHADISTSQSSFIQSNLSGAEDQSDTIDDLSAFDLESLSDWLASRACKADGSKPGTPILSVEVILTEIDKVRSGMPDLSFPYKGSVRNCWPFITAGLLRMVCGLSLREVSLWQEYSVTTACRMIHAHSHLQELEQSYAQIVAEIISSALRSEWPDSAKWKTCLFGGSA